LYSMGFVTRDDEHDELVNVFLPTAPNPTSGYMLLIPRRQLAVLSIPVEEAIKLIVSGGAIMTKEQAILVEAELPRLRTGKDASVDSQPLASLPSEEDSKS